MLEVRTAASARGDDAAAMTEQNTTNIAAAQSTVWSQRESSEGVSWYTRRMRDLFDPCSFGPSRRYLNPPPDCAPSTPT
jgi:hypothetical protein